MTTLVIPDEQPVIEAFKSCVGILTKFHMEEGESPAWVESDNQLLESLLKEHFGITKKRPKTWGQKKGST